MSKNKLTSYILVYVFAFCILCFLLTCFAQEDYVYDSKGKRNPFIPLITSDGRLLKLDKEEGVTGLSIEGIIYDKHGLSYAIANGEVVKIGDSIGGYQVLKIESNKVIFIKDAKSLEVELNKEEE
ncbi:MAG: hypothetical protein A3K83_07640 [Omnitrophica WOR_2 bacterium RBG_13_44_8b]|nr:MAG: hypothetical protein A3K83_07640 [Omnitrophica WOR_2 bacterium RBG_13_44_8b]